MMIKQAYCSRISSRNKSLARAARARSLELRENQCSQEVEGQGEIVTLRGLARNMAIIGYICKDYQDIQSTQTLDFMVNAQARSIK